MDCTPSALAKAARCWCLPENRHRSLWIHLLCLWVNGGVNNPPQTSDFTFTIDSSDIPTITVAENPPAGIPGFQGQYRVSGIGVWTGSYSPAPGSVVGSTPLNPGTTYEAQIQWATGLGQGVSIWSPSLYFTAPIPPPPVNTVLPVITGTAQVGQTLSGSNGTWTNSPTGYSYRWLANAVAIGGATANTFLLTSAQLGAVITFEVTASNSGGSGTPATSAATSAVLPAAPSKATTPSPANGATGISLTPTLTWVNGGGATSYDVYFNGSFILNQAGTSYSPSALTNNTAYTWRIDSVNTGGTTTGDAWGFTTVAITPLSFAGLVGWWKADSFALSNGTAIGDTTSHWVDQSGNGNDLVQPTPAARPVFNTNAIGAMPVITFGANKFLNFTSNIAITGNGTEGPFTVIWVGWASSDSMIFGNNVSNFQVRRGRSATNTISKVFSVGIDQSSSAFSTALGTTPLMCSWRSDSALLTGVFRENTTARGTFSEGSPVATVLNRMGTTSYGAQIDGATAEACIYTSLLSDAQIDSLYNSYFKPRWGLP